MSQCRARKDVEQQEATARPKLAPRDDVELSSVHVLPSIPLTRPLRPLDQLLQSTKTNAKLLPIMSDRSIEQHIDPCLSPTPTNIYGLRPATNIKEPQQEPSKLTHDAIAKKEIRHRKLRACDQCRKCKKKCGLPNTPGDRKQCLRCIRRQIDCTFGPDEERSASAHIIVGGDGTASSLRSSGLTVCKESSYVSSAISLQNQSTSEGEISFTGVDVTAQRDLVDVDSPNAEALDFIEELAKRLVLRALALRNDSLLKTCPGSHNKPTGSSARSYHSGIRCGKKRSQRNQSQEHNNRKDDENEDSQDEGQERQPPVDKDTSINETKIVRLFACPYAKFDPNRYSEQNQMEKRYRKCSSKYLPSIARLKQHLYRTHMRPPWYCGSCYESFKTRDELNQHNRQRPPCNQCEVMYEETMTDDQFREIKRRSLSNNSREVWFKIFKMLFPNARVPLSPYVSASDTASVQHFVNLFRWYGPDELFNLLRDRRERGDEAPELEASTQAVVDEAFEIAIADYLKQSIDHSQTAAIGSVATAQPPQNSLMASEYYSHDPRSYQRSTPNPRFSGFAVETAVTVASADNLNNPQWFPDPSQPLFDSTPLSTSEDILFDPLEVDGAFDAYDVFADNQFMPNQLSLPALKNIDPRIGLEWPRSDYG